MFDELRDGGQIGGPGLTVEIDESLFGKLKVSQRRMYLCSLNISVRENKWGDFLAFFSPY